MTLSRMEHKLMTLEADIQALNKFKISSLEEHKQQKNRMDKGDIEIKNKMKDMASEIAILKASTSEICGNSNGKHPPTGLRSADTIRTLRLDLASSEQPPQKSGRPHLFLLPAWRNNIEDLELRRAHRLSCRDPRSSTLPPHRPQRRLLHLLLNPPTRASIMAMTPLLSSLFALWGCLVHLGVVELVQPVLGKAQKLHRRSVGGQLHNVVLLLLLAGLGCICNLLVQILDALDQGGDGITKGGLHDLFMDVNCLVQLVHKHISTHANIPRCYRFTLR